jgi:spoIIIJ-associated protein
MKKVVTTGKTVEEAVRVALQKLGVPRERVHLRVLTQPSRGFFGLIGARDAQVEVEVIPDPIEDTKKFLQDVLRTMNLSEIQVEHRIEDEKNHSFHLRGPNIGIVIGRHGATLDSLQYLLNIVANKNSHTYVRITLDAEDYRRKRKESLEQLASRLAQKVARTKREIALEPMSSHERKIIHSFLQSHPQVTTLSRGEEPNRKVIIVPK